MIEAFIHSFRKLFKRKIRCEKELTNMGLLIYCAWKLNGTLHLNKTKTMKEEEVRNSRGKVKSGVETQYCLNKNADCLENDR